MNASVTLASSCQPQIDQYGLSDSVSNRDFLLTMFGDELGIARPLLVSFAGNPAKVPGKLWSGRAWSEDLDLTVALPAHANNYFSLAAFRPNGTGQYRRLKALFEALYGVMLDDVGSKVAFKKLILRPSWLLETSPGNFQAGYLLREPLADAALADRLMNAIVAAGLCDPGANGPTARLARLPVALNGKHFPPFACRLREWRPGLRYSVDELTTGFALEMTATAKPRRKRESGHRIRTDADAVWIPSQNGNAVIAALKLLGLYKKPSGEGKHEIICPWVDEHSAGLDGGTAYFEPDADWPMGGFKCFHGHCADRHISDLLGFLGVEPSLAAAQPTIRIVAGELHRVVDAAERELARMGQFFQRGGLIVTVLEDPGAVESRVKAVSQPALLRALAEAACWQRYDGRSKDWVRIRYVSVLFDATGYPHLPVLRGLARQPSARRRAFGVCGGL